MSLIWVVALLVLGFGELAALRALRGEPVTSWWTRLSEAAIGVLICAPALEILTKGYAEALPGR